MLWKPIFVDADATLDFTRMSHHALMLEHPPTRLSVILDASRWISAFLVVFGHVLHVVFNEQDPATWNQWWFLPLWLISNTNHSAVMVFFVLSGYLVGGGVFKAIRAGSFSWRVYLVNRVSRLYAVLVVALILGGLLDLIGWRWFNQGGLYDGGASFPLVSFSIIDQLGVQTFLVNLISCQRILGEHFGSNGPLWSLAYEFWYYLLCPFLAALVFGRGVLRRVLSGMALVGLMVFVGEQICFYFLIWLLGAVLPSCTWKRLPAWGWWCGAMVAYALLVSNGPLDPLISRFPIGRLRPLIEDAGVAVLFAGLLLAVQNRTAQTAVAGAVVHQRLADFSYSLYLTHFPFILCACAASQAWFGSGLQSPVSPWLLLWCAGLLLGAYIYAYAVAWCTEFRTPALRARLKAWVVPQQQKL